MLLLPCRAFVAGLGGLSVEVAEPNDASRPARFTFRGRASQRDLALMSSTLQAAMQPRRRSTVDVRALGALAGRAGRLSGPPWSCS